MVTGVEVGRRRRAIAAAGFAALTAVSAGLVIWALPGALRFVAHAPQPFWVLSLIALVVDAPLYGAGRPGPGRLRSSLGSAAALAIFVQWGAAPAILVQAVTATLSVVWQRFGAVAGVTFVGRHVCALAAAGSATLALARPTDIADDIEDVAHQVMLPYALMAAVWLLVNLAVVSAALVNSPLRERRRSLLAAAVGEDLFIVAATILLAEPLLHAEAGWWSVLAGLPLLAWSALARVRLSQERRLLQEPVTGTLNRPGLEVLTEELTIFDYVRPDRLHPFAVVVVNVDLVLDANRQFGRHAYEQLVRELASRLVLAYGAERVGRLTGEALVVILPGVTMPDAAAQAGAVARIVGPPLTVLGIPFETGASVGVAVSPEHGRDFGTLVANAEFATREARRRGLRAMVYSTQAAQDATRRLTILLELNEALTDPARRGEIGVRYQPQVAAASRRLTGVEALVRWTHPKWGPVPPDQFVEAVEPSAVMHLLTLHVLDVVARQIRRWNDQGRPTRVAVNVSVRDLRTAEFVDELAALVARHGVASGQLTIEVTERLVISSDPRVAEAAARIRELGFGLSLDDFGTGFASVDQLRTLPLTEVKIDRSYIEHVATSAQDWAIVRGLHEMTQALGLEMIAEGVEDEQTVAALARLPGVIGQGYYFGRPMTARDLDQWRAAGAPFRSRAHAR